MKKVLSLLAALLCAALLLCGCTISPLPPEPSDTPTPAPAVPSPVVSDEPEPSAEPEPETEPVKLYATVSHTYSSVTNDDGAEILSTGCDSILIKSSNSDVSDAIAAKLAELDDEYQLELGKIRISAAEYYEEAVNSGTTAMWNKYTLDRIYEPVRVDENAISVIVTISEYLGGAHPASVLTTCNFDPDTGAALSLRDVCKAGDRSLEEYINSRLPAIAARDEAAPSFFEGWEETLSTLVLDKIWYFDETGITVICNQYLIAPYVASIQYLTVPYAELNSLLDPKYMPAEESDEGGTIYVSGREPTDTSSTRVVLSEFGERFYFTTDATVSNVRLTRGMSNFETLEFTPTSVVYALNRMTPSDSIAVTAYLPEILPDLMLSYTSGGAEYEFFICQSGYDGSVFLKAR